MSCAAPPTRSIEDGSWTLDEAYVLVHGRVVSETAQTDRNDLHPKAIQGRVLVLESFSGTAGPAKDEVIDAVFDTCIRDYCQHRVVAKGEEGLFFIRDGRVGLCGPLAASPDLLNALRARPVRR